MVPEIDRNAAKQAARELLRDAQVSPHVMVVLQFGLLLLMDLLSLLCGDVEFLSTFLSILSFLTSTVLSAGFVMYCMAVRRGERAEYLCLFDGFSFAGKIIGVSLITALLISLWGMLFVIPGIVVSYRYRFALYYLYDNPELGILEAMDLSRRCTTGYKKQLLMLDISYLGWMALAALPNLVYSFLLYRDSFRQASDFMQNPTGALPVISPSAPLLPPWAWLLLISGWAIAVSLFYYAQRTCVELEYFDTARANQPASTPTLPM